MAAELRLEVRDYAGPASWRWVLTDAAGNLVAGHEVRLDPRDWQFEAFTDLPRYLWWHAAPDRRRDNDARTVNELGEWIGAEVLGPVAPALAARRPATVTVTVPDDHALDVLFRPLELAHAGGRPLAAQDVTLVMRPPGTTPPGTIPAGPAPVSGRLRVLGLFSLPDGGQALNLRRERQSLVQLIQRIHAQGKAADIRVLQYGVTRARLREVLDEAEGWDIIHISGHGAPGELLLETPEGKPDRIRAADLASLLDSAHGRVKLVTLAVCWSAATTANQQRLLLGLPVRDLASGTEPSAPGSSGPLATELASRLNCAVLAMRYPVEDEFAIELSARLYDLLADKGQPLPSAVGSTVHQLSADPRFPPLSVATPALFGQAVDLRLAAPDRQGPDDDQGKLKRSGFPPQPGRFVGRTRVMAEASEALAPASGIPGVLLHGMPGGGKTACALELAHTHEHAFPDVIWYKAPDEGAEVTGSLTGFALTLERHLPGFRMVHLVLDASRLTPFLPTLTELMEQRRLLLVIDNAESLLTPSGAWRDGSWGQVIAALTAHDGLGRLILTTRRVPTGPTAMRVAAMDALSPDEALLLARELPNLRKLSRGGIPGLKGHVARGLARRALEAAQGHPKLLELADAQATDPDRLSALVAAGNQAWREQGGLPAGFFGNPDAPPAAGDYWHVLAAWTGAVADTLAPGERDLFWLLCCLEETDRERWVLVITWASLWRQPGCEGEPPGLDEALAGVAASGLVATRPGASAALESYALHPGVAEAGRNQAGTPFRDAADTAAAAFWDTVYQKAAGKVGDGTVNTRLSVRAGLAAVPYLLRRHRWADAAWLLEAGFQRDPSRANAAAMIPAIELITRHDPGWRHVLALLLRELDPAAAETVMRDHLAASVAAGNYWPASRMALQLSYLCRNSGRLAEALDFSGQQIALTRQAGLGPWTQLSDETWRLQVLAAMGQAGHVLTEVTRLRSYLDTLPATPGPRDTAVPWNVRESLLGTGRYAARQLKRWNDALDLSAAVTASMRDRDAPATDIAHNRFNDFYPLLEQGRIDPALALLQDCLRVFQDASDSAAIGRTLTALADTEGRRGHGEAAVRLERDALRHHYLAGDVITIAAAYFNLGFHLRWFARQPARALASHLAAALIRARMGSSGDGVDSTLGAVRQASTDLRVLGTADAPVTVADLDRQLGDIPGTDLPALIRQLCPDAGTAEQTLRGLVAQAQELAAAPPLPDEQGVPPARP